jgi:hypothetical protein
VSRDDVYFSSRAQGFGAWAVRDGRIVAAGAFAAPDLAPREAVVGVLMLYDGRIAFATSAGRVGVVSRGEDGAFTLAGEMLPLGVGEVSNSFSVDEAGGIYVVGALALGRAQWDGVRLVRSWQAEYTAGEPQQLWRGRLGVGSGSTPSLMGRADGQPRFALITDGASPMRLLVLETASGELVGNATVTFRDAGEPPAADAQSEQSVVVSDDRAVVVNNFLPRDNVARACSLLTRLPGKLGLACAFMFASRPEAGVQQFRVDETGAVAAVWANEDVQCSSSIPAVARTRGGGRLFLCVGTRDTPGRWWWQPRATFTLEALDWETGFSVFSLPLGTGTAFNPSYAAASSQSRTRNSALRVL